METTAKNPVIKTVNRTLYANLSSVYKIAIEREVENMIKLQTAEEMKQVSSENYNRFQKESLESPTFKRMIKNIEQAAVHGHSRTVFNLYEDEDTNMMGVFLKVLRNAGYKVEVMFGNKISIKWSK
ncbi:hypothetical protein [Psychrobacillus phage Spoks]|nr:hypothetical protein [Psychrobacillus phage Spoks]